MLGQRITLKEESPTAEHNLITEKQALRSARSGMKTLVVDVTYRCNSPCRYCQWGSPALRKPDRAVTEACVPATTLLALGVERVVFSGGEPALHPGFETILEYYAAHISERVVITNGLLMNKRKRERLLTAGATAFTFSVDSVDERRYEANRGLPSRSLAKILKNLFDASLQRHFGLGINAVVTSATASAANVHQLLSYAADLGLDFVRFQPVFDDGYVGMNAPHLQLGPSNAEGLEAIYDLVGAGTPVLTNIPAFWRDLASLARGEQLPGSACGLGDATALLVHDRLVRCYKVASADVGFVAQPAPLDALLSVQALDLVKPSCSVDAQCFCMQSMEHKWI
jgi:pyruvate-formate lyase-activating enzyme